MSDISLKDTLEWSKWGAMVAQVDIANGSMPPEDWSIDGVIDNAFKVIDAIPAFKMDSSNPEMAAIRQYVSDTREYGALIYEQVTVPLTEEMKGKSRLGLLFLAFKNASSRLKKQAEIAESTNKLAYETALIEYLMGDKPAYEPVKAK